VVSGCSASERPDQRVAFPRIREFTVASSPKASTGRRAFTPRGAEQINLPRNQIPTTRRRPSAVDITIPRDQCPLDEEGRSPPAIWEMPLPPKQLTLLSTHQWPISYDPISRQCSTRIRIASEKKHAVHSKFRAHRASPNSNAPRLPAERGPSSLNPAKKRRLLQHLAANSSTAAQASASPTNPSVRRGHKPGSGTTRTPVSCQGAALAWCGDHLQLRGVYERTGRRKQGGRLNVLLLTSTGYEGHPVPIGTRGPIPIPTR